MSEPQGYGSEPVSQPPPAAPMPAPVAPVATPPPRTDVSKPGLVIAVIALALALIGMVAFPGPVGEEGLQGEAGPQGSTGDDGDDGSDGAQGPAGPQGLSGADGADGVDGVNGIACWDLNGNGMGDLLTEDINGDLVVDVLDCTGAQGPQGLQGLQGLQGDPGPQGIQGPPGPGSLMAADYSDADVDFNGCTNFQSVTITVPVAGSIVVTALLKMTINHQAGIRSAWGIFLETDPASCDWTQNWIDERGSGEPADISLEKSGFVVKEFQVAAGGTYTFYSNAYMWFGEDAGDTMDHGWMVAVFYPS